MASRTERERTTETAIPTVEADPTGPDPERIGRTTFQHFAAAGAPVKSRAWGDLSAVERAAWIAAGQAARDIRWGV